MAPFNVRTFGENKTMTVMTEEILRYVDPKFNTVTPQAFSVPERQVLDEVNQKVAGSVSLAGIIDYLFETTAGLIPTDRIGVAFVHEEGRRLATYYFRTNYQPVHLNKGYTQDLAGSSLELVMQTGQIRVINDLKEYLRKRPDSESTDLCLKEGIRSSMTCPLIVDDRRVGLLFRSSRLPNAYTDHHVNLHIAIAERVSQAVEKTYQYEQLAQVSHAYLEILNFISDEIEKPIARMAHEAKELMTGTLGRLTPKQTQHIRNMAGRNRQILSLVKNYTALAKIETDGLHPNIIDNVELISEVVQPVINLYEAKCNENYIRLTHMYPADKIFHACDPELMKTALNHLVSNAIKYGQAKGEIRIAVQQTDKNTCISVWNNGNGFNTEQKRRLFQRFSRLEQTALVEEKGTGLGLYLVWRIMQAHEGRAKAASEYGKWAEFYLELTR